MNFIESYYQGYTIIANDFFKMLYEKELNQSEFILLIYIKSFKNFKTHKTSIRQIAKAIHFSRDHISKSLISLEEKKFIKIKKTDYRYFIVQFLLKDIMHTIKTKKPQQNIIICEDVKDILDLKLANISGILASKRTNIGLQTDHIELNRIKYNKEINTIMPDLVISGDSDSISVPLKKKISKFDFERLYKLYPRKLGKKKGLASCVKQIKTQEDYESLEKAILNYSEFVKGKDQQFTSYFSSFMGYWEDMKNIETENEDTRWINIENNLRKEGKL